MPYGKDNARIVYMGTPAISAVVLQGLLDAGFNVVGVICNPDKPVGRKGILTPCPVKEVALSHGIPAFQPAKIRLEHEFLMELEPDVIVTMAYGQIVPKAVLDAPKRGCINLHGSLLPKLRGASPIQAAIDQGFEVTGITLMQMVEAMDAGEMYDKVEVAIEPQDDFTSLSGKLANAARDLIVKDLIPYLNGELPGTPQDENEVTVVGKIKPEDEHLDFSWPASRLLKRIRSLAMTPGGYVHLNGVELKIYKAHVVPFGTDAAPGTVVKARKAFYVATGDGTLSLDLVQLAGKKAMDGNSFVNGYRDLEGKALS